MNFVKGLMLGTAATFVATAAAQAADLPLKAKAVEYVKVCSLYGAGFYYIPGTDTCIKLGGFIRAETNFNASGATENPAWNGSSGQGSRAKNDVIYRSRNDLNIDTRTATEYGVVRTYFDSTFTWTSGAGSIAGSDYLGGGTTGIGVYFAFIQFAGFTFGKAVSQFSTPWNGTPGNIGGYLIGGDDTSTGINQVSYTAQFGNGVSGSISLEDPSATRTSQLSPGTANSVSQSLLNTSGVTATSALTTSWLSGQGSATNYTAGVQIPEIVGNVRVDQAWGLFQVSAAAHQIRASYYVPGDETQGHPGDKYGFAVLAALSLKNLPTGAGDTINIDATYADGAARYVVSGTTSNNFSMWGNSSAAYRSIAVGSAVDGVFATGTGIYTTKAWGIRGAFNHNWNANWASSVFGSYSSFDFGGTGGALYTAALKNALGGAAVNPFTGNPNFNIIQVGTRTAWTPVKNLTFTGEVQWTKLDQNYSGLTNALPNAVGTAAAGKTLEFKDQQTWTGVIRAQRNF